MKGFNQTRRSAAARAALALVGCYGLTGAAAADEVVNADRIVILSDDVQKSSSEVVHSGMAQADEGAAKAAEAEAAAKAAEAEAAAKAAEAETSATAALDASKQKKKESKGKSKR